MRSGALLTALAQLACLEAPPSGSGPGVQPVCENPGGWGASITPPGLEGMSGQGPTVSGDASLLLWETVEADIDIGGAVWNGEAFEPAPASLVAELNTTGNERNPALSADGTTVWFTRGPSGETVLYVSKRGSASDDFPAAEQVTGLGTSVEGPEAWEANSELFFSVWNGSDYDLARASCSGVRSCTLEDTLSQLDTGLNDVYPAIRADGLELIYFQGDAIVVALRETTDGEFTTAEPLGIAGFDPDLTADGQALYYHLAATIYRTTRSCLD